MGLLGGELAFECDDDGTVHVTSKSCGAEATITNVADVCASNGVIHTIDAPLYCPALPSCPPPRCVCSDDHTVDCMIAGNTRKLLFGEVPRDPCRKPEANDPVCAGDFACVQVLESHIPDNCVHEPSAWSVCPPTVCADA